LEYFFSVNERRSADIKIKRSTFIAHLQYVDTMQDAKKLISDISLERKTANHNCWAYIVGQKGQTYHSSDAGEPSGTAGQPMLNMLKKHNMTNIVAVVTRYFGGVKLGIRGLIEAYGQAVEIAIESEPLKILVTYQNYSITTSYDFAETLKHRIKKMKAEIDNIEYTEYVSMNIRIEDFEKKELDIFLTELAKAGKIKINN